MTAELFAIGTSVVSTNDNHIIERPALVLPLQG
jgi:hypothetical protein